MKYTFSLLNNNSTNFSLMTFKMCILFSFWLSVQICNYIATNEQNFPFFSQLTAKREDLSETYFQKAMFFPDWLLKLTIISQQNSLFLPIVSKMYDSFRFWLHKIHNYFSGKQQILGLFFSWFVSKCIISFTIDCINLQLFYITTSKLALFFCLLFQNAWYFSQLNA